MKFNPLCLVRRMEGQERVMVERGRTKDNMLEVAELRGLEIVMVERWKNQRHVGSSRLLCQGGHPVFCSDTRHYTFKSIGNKY